uniref:EGF-like domain-containing protein n=1 Tax=Chromulina nebulosa TaxID=96789 RepID=A0A7S0SS37_9STRA|mmetsp:Transcript_1754/g.1565  ORF Transcript_1754/g.1565 Transcript_1754/m.1565 type:complete len:213 (+) Transcript_1754:93-731(+)
MERKMFFSILLLLLITYIYCNCPNGCSGHGSCGSNDKCTCYTRIDGDPAWTYADCSGRTCPKAIAWVGEVSNTNDAHPLTECSNKGTCDRKTGQCICYPNYDGIACDRTICPNRCSESGVCFTEYQLASEAGRTYSTPWDANKYVGCVCDLGRRGPDCSLLECPSGADVLGGYGNETGRDCSGRGICDYSSGICGCFHGYYGHRCEYQTVLG